MTAFSRQRPTASTVIPENLKPLLGRWVVVSSEGAALGSAALMRDADGSLFGSTTPGGLAGGGSVSVGLGTGGMGASVTSPPLQWIEFSADHVVVFDGREAKLFVEFSEDTEPKRLLLRHQSDQSPNAATVWRYGIYLLDLDRLIVCWSPNLPIPTEFAVNDRNDAQLLVLRREWNPPADFVFSNDTPLPRAVIPFTADEAKRYQDAWASSANDFGIHDLLGNVFAFSTSRSRPDRATRIASD